MTSEQVLEAQKEIKVTQRSFSGGMNLFRDPSKLQEDEYTLLSNGRPRFDTIEPIKLPLEIMDGVPPGKKQGCYAAGSYILLFVAGLAYYRNFDNPAVTHFTPVAGFTAMSATVDYIFAALVPASFNNYTRKLAPSENVKDDVLFVGSISGSPQCIVVQDGINQPQIISTVVAARTAYTYLQWTTTFREYIPVGTVMRYIGSILYIVSPDRSQIYRSVSGRPLDFMVIIDTLGNKLPSEMDGGASMVSHKASFNPIIEIKPLNTQDGAFIVSTVADTIKVIPDFTDLQYGEPSFSNIPLFSTGVISPHSITELLGDTVLVDVKGLVSFNAVEQAGIEGQNSPFSLQISELFNGINQTVTCAISFDNYGFFALDSIYGYGVLIYDTLLEKFVSFDLLSNVEGKILQFAELKISGRRSLFFITDDNKLFEYNASSSTALCGLYTRELCSNDPEVEQYLTGLKLIFLDTEEAGSVSVTPILDRFRGETLSKSLKVNLIPQAYPIDIPFGNSNTDTTKNIIFKWNKEQVSWKIGFLIQWNFHSNLSHFSSMSKAEMSEITLEDQGISIYTPSV